MALSPDRPPPAPSLPDYKLAEKLGQGAFGSVYRIDLSHIPESELPDIMSEIDLLKNLHHPNIVQYRGYARTSTSLYIILEYCENGSLSAIIKKFGRIPESLVGLYTLQVLQGLQYLHDQGVIHRDIKGSNILATKEGSIKLADFGVATRVGGAPDSAVVGSPYWMAPEVVDQSGASPASDIWSLGALVVELLTGKPPYHFLDPMPALFRIVNDDAPPLPSGASAGVRDFLTQCFQKDANLRVGARKLLRHPWMVAAKRQADAQAAESAARDGAAGRRRAEGGAGGAGAGRERPSSTYEEEVRAVKEWNEALKAAPAAPRLSALPAPRLPLRPRAAPTAAAATPAQELASALLKPSPAVTPARRATAEKAEQEDGGSDNWDSDFEEGISVGKIAAVAASPSPSPSPAASGEEEEEEDARGNSMTIRPSRLQAGKLGGARAMVPIVEDYSDLVGEEEEVFARRVSSFREKNKARPQLLRPSDLAALSPSPAVSPAPSPPHGHARTPSAIEKYTEEDEDDYSDVFGGRSEIQSEESLKLNTRLSGRSWLGDEDSDEEDPFALVDSSLALGLSDPDDDADAAGAFEYTPADLERDQLARQCALVGELVDVVGSLSARREGDAADVREAALQLTTLLEESPEARAHFLKSHGLLVVLEALRVARSREMLSILLRVVNLIVGSDAGTLEKVALVGGCPVVMAFSSRRYAREIRLEAALFIDAEGKDLVWMAVDGISRVFEMQGPTPRNDFCRILTQEGLLDPLSTALLAVCGDGDDLAESAKAKIVHILLLFAQSDHKVKEAMARRAILLRLVKAAGVLEPELLAVLLKTLKNLSMLPAALDPLQHAGAIEMLVAILAQTYRGRLAAEIQNHAVNALFNLCRLSKARQAEAAAAGAIPLLQRIVGDSSPLKQFALPILCDFAHAGKACRKLLWQHDGVALYLQLLKDTFWVNPALEAILVWLQDETTRVEECLLEQSAIDALVRLFCKTKSTVFENLLEPLHKILRTSPVLAAKLAVQSGFIKRLVERLERASHALVRLNLLRITKTVFDALQHDRRDRDKAVRILAGPVVRLASEDKAVLSRQLAKSLAAEFAATKEETRRLLASRSVRRSVSESAAASAGGAADSSPRRLYRPPPPLSPPADARVNASSSRRSVLGAFANPPPQPSTPRSAPPRGT
ncbi:Protein kinase of the Mitotic Exit Network [Rhodotorula kratochvilovae]